MNRTTTFIDSLGALLWNPGTGVLIALLVIAAWIDWRTMRIPNWLTVGGMCWGVMWNAASANSGIQGMFTGIGGLAVGLLLFLPFWLMRVMGAGDVKLMAAVGAFLGTSAVFKAALVVGVVGGIAVFAFAVTHRSVGRLVSNLRGIAWSWATPGAGMGRSDVTTASIGNLPYGVSICLGTVTFLMLRHWGFE